MIRVFALSILLLFPPIANSGWLTPIIKTLSRSGDDVAKQAAKNADELPPPKLKEAGDNADSISKQGDEAEAEPGDTVGDELIDKALRECMRECEEDSDDPDQDS